MDAVGRRGGLIIFQNSYRFNRYTKRKIENWFYVPLSNRNVIEVGSADALVCDSDIIIADEVEQTRTRASERARSKNIRRLSISNCYAVEEHIFGCSAAVVIFFLSVFYK